MIRIATAVLLAVACFAQTDESVRRIQTSRGTITYTIQGGYAITEGDIILGTAEAVEAYRQSAGESDGRLSPRALTMIPSTSSRLWPDGTIYYTIDADVPNQQSILDAIAHWNARTPLRILPRTNQTNYVHMERVNIDAACNSYIGMIGGEQSLGVTNVCPTGSMIHELGHAFGLWHEQQRRDRGGHLTVLYDNLDKRYIDNFPEAPSSSTNEAAYYDFDSIMHYSATGFTKNYLDSLETSPVGIPLGQRNGLSAGDIDGVTRLYGLTPSATTITTVPAGLDVTVDGVTAASPQTFNWAPGSRHTVSVVATQGSDPRYVFAKWSDGGEQSHTITASTNLTAFSAAYVRERPFRIAAPSAQGSVSAFPTSADGFLPERMPVAVSATPATGYSFVRWTGSTFLAASGQSLSANPALVRVGNGTNNYTPVFTTGPVTTVNSQPAGANVTVDGTSYLAPARFAWTPGSSHTLSVTSPQLYGNNTRRLQFLNWEDGSQGSRTVIAGGANAAYTATFRQQFLVTNGTSGTGTVTRTPASSDGFYDEGTEVTFTATATGGRVLRYWAGDVAGNRTTSTIVVNEQKDTDAYFGTPINFRILNSASFLPHSRLGSTTTAVAPGQIVAIFSSATGVDLGPANGIFGTIDSSGKLPLSLGDTTVTFDGLPAPLLYVSATQLNAVVPYGLDGKTTATVVVRSGSSNYTATVEVEATAPALFTANGSGRGPLAALNENGSINSATNPAAPGSVVVLYATGAGKFASSYPDGQVLGADIARTAAPVWVRLGKLDGELLYAGTAPYLVNGAMQVNVRLPKDLITGGLVSVQLVVGRFSSQAGTSIYVAGR